MSRSKPSGPMSRRGMLAALGLGAAAGTAACKRGWVPPEKEPTSRPVAKPYVPGSEAYGVHEERWFQSACGECPAGCGIKVRVVEGRAVRIEGSKENPLNRGGIGPRGLSALQGLYDADRLTGPLKRVGGRLVPIGWDEAIAELALDLQQLRARGEPDRLLVWSGLERGVMVDLLARFARAYGTPNLIDGRPGHTGVLSQAMHAMLGSPEIPVYGWDDANYILSLEAGLFEDSCQLVYFTRVAAQLRRGAGRRAHLVHAGPMLDLSAINADDWVRIRPGTSGALALGLARQLLDQHPEIVLPADLATGAAEFRAFVSRFTPEEVQARTGVPVRTQVRLADELWAQRPSLVVVSERSLAYSNGLDNALAAMALNAVLGSFWEPSGGVRKAPVVPLRDWPQVDPDGIARAGLARPRLDGAADYLRATSVHENLPEAIAAAGARAPAVLLLHHANPAYSRQQPKRWAQALAAIPKVVSFSPYRDETVDGFAHLVLPDHTFLERWEAVVPAPALERASITLRAPVVAPLHDTRATGDVVIDLARRIGGPVAAAMPWSSFREATERRLHGLHASLRGNLMATTTNEFLRELKKVGFWIDDVPPPQPPARVTLHASWSEPTWHGDPEQYPLALLVYRPLGHAEGGGAARPWLRTLRPHPGARAWSFDAHINPASAPGVRNGDRVRVESEWGAISIAVEFDERMELGYIAIPLGAGHTSFGRWAEGFGANVLELLRPGPAPVTGADLLCATRVRIRPDGGVS